MKITSSVDGAKNFDRAFAEFMATSKRELPVVMREQMRGIIKNVIGVTPPSSITRDGNGGWSIMQGGAAKKQGENAIAGDLFGGRVVDMGGFSVRTEGLFIVSDTDPNQYSDHIADYRSQNNNPLFRKKEGPGDAEIARLFTNKKGEVYGVERQLFRPAASLAEMLAHIKPYRSPTTGKITRAGLRSKTIGRNVFIDRMVIGTAAKRVLMKHLFEAVGFLASAWKPAAQALGVKLPSWIARLDAPGSISVSGDGLNFEITNALRYAADTKGLRGRVESAVNQQAKKMERRVASFHAAKAERAQKRLNAK